MEGDIMANNNISTSCHKKYKTLLNTIDLNFGLQISDITNQIKDADINMRGQHSEILNVTTNISMHAYIFNKTQMIELFRKIRQNLKDYKHRSEIIYINRYPCPIPEHEI
jgi:hypothetical protein